MHSFATLSGKKAREVNRQLPIFSNPFFTIWICSYGATALAHPQARIPPIHIRNPSGEYRGENWLRYSESSQQSKIIIVQKGMEMHFKQGQRLRQRYMAETALLSTKYSRYDARLKKKRKSKKMSFVLDDTSFSWYSSMHSVSNGQYGFILFQLVNFNLQWMKNWSSHNQILPHILRTRMDGLLHGHPFQCIRDRRAKIEWGASLVIFVCLFCQ